MPQQVKMEIINTIPTPSESGGDYEYENLLAANETKTFTAGLVAIKNCKKTTQWGERDAYRLTFRVAGKPDSRAYINTTINASAKENSHMYKLLRNMSGKKVTTLPNSQYADSDRLFNFMLSCQNKWFEVDSIGIQLKNGDVMMCVDGDDVRPAARHPKSAPFDYFESIDNTTITDPNATGLEKYPDAPQAEAAKHKAQEDKELAEDDLPDWFNSVEDGKEDDISF